MVDTQAVLKRWEETKADYGQPDSMVYSPDLYTCAYDLAEVVESLSLRLEEVREILAERLKAEERR